MGSYMYIPNKNDPDPVIGELKYILQQLKSVGVTREKLGERIGVKAETITNWALGRVKIGFENFLKIREVAHQIIPDIFQMVIEQNPDTRVIGPISDEEYAKRLKDIPTIALVKELKSRGFMVTLTA